MYILLSPITKKKKKRAIKCVSHKIKDDLCTRSTITVIKIHTDYNIAWQIQRQAEHSLGQKSRSWYQKAILKTRKILEDCIFSYANSSNPYLQFQPYSKLWKPQQSMVYSMMNLLLSNSGCSTSNIYIFFFLQQTLHPYFWWKQTWKMLERVPPMNSEEIQ